MSIIVEDFRSMIPNPINGSPYIICITFPEEGANFNLSRGETFFTYIRVLFLYVISIELNGGLRA